MRHGKTYRLSQRMTLLKQEGFNLISDYLELELRVKNNSHYPVIIEHVEDGILIRLNKAKLIQLDEPPLGAA